MSQFAKELQAFVNKARSREGTLYRRATVHAFESIRHGSAVTGAPGQPVDTGELLASWQLTPTGRRTATMLSNAVHADIIEHNRRGATLRSKVGGFHSVKLTRLGWRRIVAHELRQMGPGPGDGNSRPVAPPAKVRNPQQRDRRGRFTRPKSAQLQTRG